MTFTKEPDVFIPVGTPGIDHAGHAYRMDNVVAIRLKKLRHSGLPSTDQVMKPLNTLCRHKIAPAFSALITSMSFGKTIC